MLTAPMVLHQYVLRHAHPPPSTLPLRLVSATGGRLSQQQRHRATGGATTKKSSSSRRQITVANDDGRLRWGELSTREKAARTTQQSFNLLTILTGLVMTGGVFTLLYLEVFSLESKTSHFNRAFDRVRRDPQCTELLGSAKKIKAYGEPTWNKWARARPIASNLSKDPNGAEHLQMHFNVEGPSNKGVVNLHMVKRSGSSEFEYLFLALDVPGHSRVYLENTEATGGSKEPKKIFGIRWS